MERVSCFVAVDDEIAHIANDVRGEVWGIVQEEGIDFGLLGEKDIASLVSLAFFKVIKSYSQSIGTS